MPLSAIKKALLTSAFFIARRNFGLLVSLVLLVATTPAGADPCLPDHVDEHVVISAVFDGDTVRLGDGRHVRLIGINAPELAHDGLAAEPLADEARQALVAMLDQAQSIGLRYDTQRHDHYGRTLAQLFIDDKQNVQAALVADGYAAVIAVPPNLYGQTCLWQQEQLALQQHRGRWRLARYRPVDVQRLTSDMRGFMIIRGRVDKVSRTTKSLWLDLGSKLSLRIATQDWHYFDTAAINNLTGKTITARGWLYSYRNRLRMRLRHPNNLSWQQ